MPTPLLQYSVSTAPAPLQASTTGAITIVANNPGGYSDVAAKDYVDVSSIVFDFGVVGSDGSDLTTGAGSTWTVTPPANWGAPSISGLQFTFTPPAGARHISPNSGLAFMFEGFPVNATVGTVSLVITESASTPGDPAQPTVYPSIGPQVANVTKLLGKFPLDFTMGEFSAVPTNIALGGSTLLSWDDSPGAVYTLQFGSQSIVQHANGTLLKSTDTYPNTADGDAPLVLDGTTVFTLDVTYTPPGGSSPATLQRQVAVSVSYPDITATNATLNGTLQSNALIVGAGIFPPPPYPALITSGSQGSGLAIGWNNADGGQGETDFYNYGQRGPGGFDFYNSSQNANSYSAGPPKRLLKIDSSGNLTATGAIKSSQNFIDGNTVAHHGGWAGPRADFTNQSGTLQSTGGLTIGSLDGFSQTSGEGNYGYYEIDLTAVCSGVLTVDMLIAGGNGMGFWHIVSSNAAPPMGNPFFNPTGAGTHQIWSTYQNPSCGQIFGSTSGYYVLPMKISAYFSGQYIYIGATDMGHGQLCLKINNVAANPNGGMD